MMQWKMKMKRPWRLLRMVNTYAITRVCSLTYSRPNAQVRPSRTTRTTAPSTHDLQVDGTSWWHHDDTTSGHQATCGEICSDGQQLGGGKNTISQPVNRWFLKNSSSNGWQILVTPTKQSVNRWFFTSDQLKRQLDNIKKKFRIS